ncbi:conserved hypothetical protein [Trichormus variabilis ATCC 29413]|uniref:DUF7925 domain-containing protein n=2 Tax=Anabaena variabilis TaxID=264691 RepID=Q3M388_TRIV2|nr:MULTISPECIES: hypothetical protein [Nostocaceae]ABA24548.1 conserved hypothetical protein [Trichormus variabilis ATCC 29413]MBC1212858.1 hypothetical protein [Trichormus variabilis ARAD]MBC1255294.1 hypothetical protein [Trichormus variabilis V5]MBC1266047.1 hypothetical protein [Trichormus variabilis FSR]MBC1301304.1 hypothetical protein [Trichormus variabilis N2B]
MNFHQKAHKTGKSKIYRALVATAFLASGIFPFTTPALAEGTKAGTSIRNEATATYEDPNNPNVPLNTTSNTVTVTVAEVAGITVDYTGLVDNNGGTIEENDLLIFNYTITNVGNDPTQFRIPNLATTTGPATVSGTLPNNGTLNNLQYSIDNGVTWVNITGSEAIVPNIAVGGQVLVRVPVTVQPGAQSGDVITVKLGNTPANAQNVLRSPDGGDVYTVDNPNGSVTDEVDGAPVNGTREASDTSINVQVGGGVKTYSLATVLKTRTAYNNGGTTNSITDDTLTYGLSLRVEGNDPTGQGITPAALEGRGINLDGIPNVPHILVSDAIPTGTDLASVSAPNGWTAVYTTSPITTDANAAAWTTTAPANLSTVTRVGFINNTATVTSVAPNQTVNNFIINLRVESNFAGTSLNVANIAQLFGQTPGNNFPVYDESGDQNPSNFDGQVGNMTPPPGTDTNNDGVPDRLLDADVDDGFVDSPATPETGVDGNNDNTGVGTGGEANIFTLEVPVASAVLNGPVNAPNAIGPSGGTNDDFTNKSSLVPFGTQPNSTLNPQPVAFTNTIRNSGSAPSNYSLVPIPPASNTPAGNNADLPVGTLVTITYASESRSYVWTGSEFLFDSDRNPATTGDQSPIDLASEYITIPNVAPGTNINYGVEIDLPDPTQLSTDIDRGFPVPITAFVDDGTPGLGTETVRNTTINRVYTGFLKLRKLSRILDQNGQPVAGPDGQLSDSNKSPVPGNIIEYQIQYSNISEPQSGNGNIILNASNVVINENGVTAPNNWALDNDGNNQIDTSNIIGSATDPNGTIQFFNGNPATTSGSDQTGTTVNTDVTRYVNSVTGQVAPGQQRTFTFRRKVN